MWKVLVVLESTVNLERAGSSVWLECREQAREWWAVRLERGNTQQIKYCLTFWLLFVYKTHISFAFFHLVSYFPHFHLLSVFHLIDYNTLFIMKIIIIVLIAFIFF